MDWHGDTKAHASKFYPTNGRKGKKMTGKVGHDELMRARDSKWLSKWFEMFYTRHGRYPSTEEKYEVMLTCSLRAEYDRLSDVYRSVVIDRDVSDMLATEGSTSTYLEKSIDKMRAEDAAAKAASPYDYTQATEAEIAARKIRFDLRTKCPIPVEMLRKVLEKKMPKETIMDVYDVTEADFKLYFDAMFGE